MLKYADINRALIKPSPNTIPLSQPRCANNDYYEIHILIPDLDWNLLCKSKENNGYSGFLWIENQDGCDATVLFSTLEHYQFTTEITHYYKCYTFKYHTKFKFLLSQLFNWHKIEIAKDKFVQAVYNRKTLVRSERMELLNYLVEKTIENSEYSTTPMNLGVHMHSQRWFYHPERKEHQSHYKLLLDSLVDSGDLDVNNRSYSVTGKALATLSEYERDQQKHQDDFNNAKTAHHLTWGLIFIGTISVLSQLFMWWVGE